jgi:hypothetical protein
MTKMPEATQLALEHLIRTASEDKVLIAGFAFGEEPVFIAAFGNCTDHAKIELYELLCQAVSDKKKLGLVEDMPVRRVN